MNKEQFFKDQTEALTELDQEKVAAYLEKYGEHEAAADVRAGKEEAWAGMHHARVMCTPVPLERKRESVQWFAERQTRYPKLYQEVRNEVTRLTTMFQDRPFNPNLNKQQ